MSHTGRHEKQRIHYSRFIAVPACASLASDSDTAESVPGRDVEPAATSSPPVEVRVDLVVVEGDAATHLARTQGTAIREVLHWFATNPQNPAIRHRASDPLLHIPPDPERWSSARATTGDPAEDRDAAQAATPAQAAVLRSSMRSRGSRVEPETGQADPDTHPATMSFLLELTTKLFTEHIIDLRRWRSIAADATVTGPAAQPPGAGQPTDLPAPAIDLRVLPPDLLQQLLDAFEMEIHVDPPRGAVRLRVTIGPGVEVSAPAGRPLQVEVPQGWPALTPSAARALLRLLTTVAKRRNHTADPTHMRPS